MYSRSPRRSGFTLLELLVVISIIGLLVALGAVAFTTAQKRGRDAKRVGDMKAVQKAMEQYYAVNGSYPATTIWSSLGTSYLQGEYFNGTFPVETQPGHTDYTVSATTTTYCICADLERDSDGNYGSSGCATSGDGFFCVKNLQ